MKRVAAGMAIFAGLAFAVGWTGVLFDADCKQPGKPEACPVTANTRHFGLVRHGFLGARTWYTVAEEGNEKILATLADRQKKTGAAPQGTNVQVWFTGKPDGHKLALNDFALK